jgi:hypothetical protein
VSDYAYLFGRWDLREDEDLPEEATRSGFTILLDRAP